jgi:hypothetical protein
MRSWCVHSPRLLLLSLLLAAACSGTTTPAAQPSTADTPPRLPPATQAPAATPTHRQVAPSASPPAAAYVLGAKALPLRPDGFGEVLPTPVLLRHRRLTAVDTLAPPLDNQFHSTIRPISAIVRTRMGDTYRAGCPVPISQLSYLTLTFRGFDGRAHTGELIVATPAAEKTVSAFRVLYERDFPIEQMQIATTDDVHAKPTGDGNDTAGFVCRAARGQRRFSAHAYGLAIDINPFQNPYVKGDLVLPELASAYRDRTWVRAGMFLPGGAAVRAFTSQGFTWGGTFSSPKDYQHMSLNGT